MFFLCRLYAKDDDEIQWSQLFSTRKEAIEYMLERHFNDHVTIVKDQVFYSEKFTCTEDIDTLYYFLVDEYSKLPNGTAFPNVIYTNDKPLGEQIVSATSFDQLCVCEIFTK